MVLTPGGGVRITLGGFTALGGGSGAGAGIGLAGNTRIFDGLGWTADGGGGAGGKEHADASLARGPVGPLPSGPRTRRSKG